MYFTGIHPTVAVVVAMVVSICSCDSLNEFNVNCIEALGIPIRGERPDVSRLVSYIGASDTTNAHLLQLSRHHIIPYATLRNFYNALLHNGHRAGFERLVNEVINALAPYAYRGRTLSLTNRRELPSTLSDLTRTILEQPNTDDIARSHQIYAWMPFNIYVGPSPSLRDDDPGENVFDSTAYTVVGNAVATRLREIHEHMTLYINSGDEYEMNEALNRLRTEATRRLVPYMFNRYYWRVRTDPVDNRYLFALNTERVAIDRRYRDLTADDFCMITEVNARGNRRPRRSLLPLCIMGYTNADAFCANTLETMRSMNTNNALMYVSFEIPAQQPTTSKSHACNYGTGTWPVKCH